MNPYPGHRMETLHQKGLMVGRASVFKASRGETNYQSEGDNYRIQGDVVIGSTSRFKEKMQ